MRAESRFLRRMALCVFVLGLANAAFAIYATSVTRHRWPSLDLWSFFQSLAQSGSIWDTAFAQYENHRLAVVGFLTYWDLILFGAEGTSVYVLVVGAMAIVTAMACRGLRANGTSMAVVYAVCGAVFAMIFSLQAAEGIVMRYRSWIPLTLVFAVLCHLAMAFSILAIDGRDRRVYLSIACLLGIVCLYTGAPGLLIWPSLIVSMLFCRAPPRAVAVVLAVAFLACTVFLTGLGGFFDWGGGGFANVRNPIRLMVGYAAFIGRPLGQTLFMAPFNAWSDSVSVLAGFVAILAGLLIAVRVAGYGCRSTLQIAVFGLTVFTAGWLMAATIKHQAPAPGPWIPVAKSSDFMAALVLWSCLVIQIALWVDSAGRPLARGMLLIACGLVVLALSPLQVLTYYNLKRIEQEVVLGNFAAVSNVEESKARHLHTFLKVVTDSQDGRTSGSSRIDQPFSWSNTIGLPLRYGVPPFDRSIFAALARRETMRFPDSGIACRSALLDKAKIVNGYRVWGALDDRSGMDRSAAQIVVVGSDSVIVGVGGMLDRLDPDLARLLVINDRKTNWVAYAAGADGAELKGYVLDRSSDRACRLF